jgi:hypothetical protein
MNIDVVARLALRRGWGLHFHTASGAGILTCVCVLFGRDSRVGRNARVVFVARAARQIPRRSAACLRPGEDWRPGVQLSSLLPFTEPAGGATMTTTMRHDAAGMAGARGVARRPKYVLPRRKVIQMSCFRRLGSGVVVPILHFGWAASLDHF